MVFNNRFNNKDKDPLVEAAKAAMELGQKRREAINAVNEEFGVYSRNAVVREQLAAYDARIEEVYKGMMAGNLTEELSPKQKKMASLGGNPNKIDAPDLAKLRKGAKIDEKKGCYEEKKLADKDYDKDGKIESPKDEVWGSRLRAAKLAGKLKEGKKAWEEETDYSAPDRAAVTKDNKPSVSPTAPKVNTSGPSAADKAGLAAKIGAMKEAKLDELTKPTAKTAMKAYHRAYDSDVRSGEGERSNRLYKWKQKHLPGKSARNQKDTGKADLPDVGNIEFHKAGYSGHVTKGGKLTKAASRDTKDGIKSRLGKHTKPHLPEETIEEAVSRKHFQQVADLIKGHESQEKRNELATHHAGIFAKQNPRFDHGRFHKAAGSTAHEAPKKMEEAAYSAKAARAGKDIGKPGKSFKMIAKKAGKEYGSEEKGKKVAGAILAKIRAKHMEEQVTLMPTAAAKPAAKAPIIPKSALAPGQSLRDYMNQQKGLTRRDAPAPKTSAVPSVPKPTPKAAADTSGQAKMDAMNKLGQTPAPTPAQTKQASDIVRDKGPSMTRQYSFPGSTVAPPKADVDTKTPKNPSSAADVSGASKMSAMDKLSSAPTPAPTPEVSKQASDIVRGKGPSMTRPGTPAPNLNESVQVGANKYRIV
jgi:hypothetical protein